MMRSKIWFWVAVAALCLGLLYYFADPTSRWMPKCLFHSITGLDCPGCGAQRMTHALLHGDFSAAWHSNALLLCMIPIIPFGIWADLRPGRVRDIFYNPWTAWTLTALIVLWGVFRNIL